MAKTVKTSKERILGDLLSLQKHSAPQVVLTTYLKVSKHCAVTFIKGEFHAHTHPFVRGCDTLVRLDATWHALFQPGFRYTQALHTLSQLDDASGSETSSHTFSAPEDGTVFEDLFACAKEVVQEGQSTSEQSLPEEVDPSDLTLFIADEDLPMNTLLHGAFASRGYTVQTFDLGQELIARCAHHIPHAILLGDDLKDMKGLDVTAKVRTILGCDVPILLLSGFDVDEIAVDAYRRGVSDCVQKPVNMKALIEKVSHHLSVYS